MLSNQFFILIDYGLIKFFIYLFCHLIYVLIIGHSIRENESYDGKIFLKLTHDLNNNYLQVVALSITGFESMTPPYIVQEYRDHDESFYKVYVIDKEVMVFRRPSLPNLDELAVLVGNQRNQHRNNNPNNCSGLIPHNSSMSDLESQSKSHYMGLRSVEFDSRYAYPTADDFMDPNRAIAVSHSSKNEVNDCDINYCSNGVAVGGAATCCNNNGNILISSSGSSSSSSSSSSGHNVCIDSEMSRKGRDRVLSVDGKGRAKKPSAKDMPSYSNAEDHFTSHQSPSSSSACFSSSSSSSPPSSSSYMSVPIPLNPNGKDKREDQVHSEYKKHDKGDRSSNNSISQLHRNPAHSTEHDNICDIDAYDAQIRTRSLSEGVGLKRNSFAFVNEG